MHGMLRRMAPTVALFAVVGVAPAHAQHTGHTQTVADSATHRMFTTSLGRGWTLAAMAQLHPILTMGAPGAEDGPLRETEAYLTQPAIMADILSPGARWVLRATLDFEALTQEGGELTFGGWGEGFIDRRHPHTLLHELMVSTRMWEGSQGALSVSAGKGFTPYGPADPMSRPGIKYPTNHHLSQILERWTLNGTLVVGAWSVEAGVFAGGEPVDPYDLGSLDSFGQSWSARLARHWGGAPPFGAWEASLSLGSVLEEHHDEPQRTTLWNGFVRHTRTTSSGDVYALAELSHGSTPDEDGYVSALVEGRVDVHGHSPYARIELATRPEYVRDGTDEEAFFRYHHDDEPIGATRWLIVTAGYGYRVSRYPVSVRPFVEAQFHDVAGERGNVDPAALFGRTRFWGVSLGARIFLGGDPMRMGAYGVLDPMVVMGRGNGHAH